MSSSQVGSSKIRSIEQSEMSVEQGDWLQVGFSIQTPQTVSSRSETIIGHQPFQVPSGWPQRMNTKEFMKSFHQQNAHALAQSVLMGHSAYHLAGNSKVEIHSVEKISPPGSGHIPSDQETLANTYMKNFR